MSRFKKHPYARKHMKKFMKDKPPALRVLAIIGMTIGGIALAVLFAFAFGIFVKLLWNWLMPSLFGLKEIGFWQAVGLIILIKLLFGAIGGRGGHKNNDSSWECDDEDAEEVFIEENFCNMNSHERKKYREYWEKEGKEAFQRYTEERQAHNEQDQ